MSNPDKTTTELDTRAVEAAARITERLPRVERPVRVDTAELDRCPACDLPFASDEAADHEESCTCALCIGSCWSEWTAEPCDAVRPTSVGEPLNDRTILIAIAEEHEAGRNRTRLDSLRAATLRRVADEIDALRAERDELTEMYNAELVDARRNSKLFDIATQLAKIATDERDAALSQVRQLEASVSFQVARAESAERAHADAERRCERAGEDIVAILSGNLIPEADLEEEKRLHRLSILRAELAEADRDEAVRLLRGIMIGTSREQWDAAFDEATAFLDVHPGKP